MPSRRTWLTIHRIIGLYSLVFLLILALSGLVLSFSEALKLEERQVFTSTSSVRVNGHTVSLSGERVLLDAHDAGIRCHGPVVGVVDLSLHEQMGVQVACQNALYWLSWEGDAIDSVNVPVEHRPLVSSAYGQSGLILESAIGHLIWHLEPSSLKSIPSPELHTALPSIDHQGSNMAQSLLNLHTGLIAGDLGRWLMRLAGLGLLLLCLSGLKNALRR